MLEHFTLLHQQSYLCTVVFIWLYAFGRRPNWILIYHYSPIAGCQCIVLYALVLKTVSMRQVDSINYVQIGTYFLDFTCPGERHYSVLAHIYKWNSSVDWIIQPQVVTSLRKKNSEPWRRQQKSNLIYCTWRNGGLLIIKKNIERDMIAYDNI